jgi:hypothetical protein
MGAGFPMKPSGSPLFALAVAVGVGILIGMVSRHWD